MSRCRFIFFTFSILSRSFPVQCVLWPWYRPRKWAGWRWSPTALHWWFPASCRCWPNAWGRLDGLAGREPGGPSCWGSTCITRCLHAGYTGFCFFFTAKLVGANPHASPTRPDSHSNGTHAGSASTVGDAESLVQVKMRHVRAVVCWPAQSHLMGSEGELEKNRWPIVKMWYFSFCIRTGLLTFWSITVGIACAKFC